MDAVGSSQGGLAITKDVPGQANLWRPVVHVLFVELAPTPALTCKAKGSVGISKKSCVCGFGEFRPVGNQVQPVTLAKHPRILPAHTIVEGEPREHTPTVAEVEGVVIEFVVAAVNSALDKAGILAGNVEFCECIVHKPCQRCQQIVGTGTFGGACARKVGRG